MFPGKHKISRLTFASLFLAGGLLFTACSQNNSPETGIPAVPAPTRAGQLTPYVSPTLPVAGSETPRAGLPTPTPLPSPTPTPHTHVVKKGEDMGGIAFMYHVSVEALMEANPTVQPNLMSVGTTLVIPPSKTQSTGENAAAGPGVEQQTPTPVPVEASRQTCTRVEDGGVWCFLLVRNTRSFALEGLSAVFRLADNQGRNVAVQTAFLPLDTLPAGASLPLIAYFPYDQASRLAPPYQFSSEMLSALPSANNGRYLTTRVEGSQVMVAEDGLSAAISATVVLKASETAKRVWVAAVAYDAEGNVVGVRRWEKPDDQPVKGGQPLAVSLAVSMSVYSVSNPIARVELVAEARP